MKNLYNIFKEYKTMLVLLLAVIASGCTTMDDGRKQANMRWNSARSTISLSQASQQMDNGNIEGAYVSVLKALERDPENYQANVLMARVLIAKRDFNNAFAQLDVLAALDPSDTEIDFLRGIAYEQKGHYERALQYYRNACEKSPANVKYLFAQAECLSALKRTQMALDVVQDKLIPVSESFAAYQLGGDLAMTLKKYDIAIKDYASATCLNPESDSTRKALADAYYFSNQPIEAASILDALTKKEPYKYSAWTFSMLGDCYMAMGQPQEASISYEMACELDQDNVALLVNLAKSSLASDDLPRAILSSRRALRRDKNNISATMVMAYSLMRQGKNAQAIEHLITSHNANPDDVTLMCLLGQAYEGQGNRELAKRYYSQAVKVDANSKLAKNLLSAVAGR